MLSFSRLPLKWVSTNAKYASSLSILSDRDHLLELLLEAFLCGSDEYMEPVHSDVQVEEVAEVDAPPQMRRQLIRLRNSKEVS